MWPWRVFYSASSRVNNCATLCFLSALAWAIHQVWHTSSQHKRKQDFTCPPWHHVRWQVCRCHRWFPRHVIKRLKATLHTRRPTCEVIGDGSASFSRQLITCQHDHNKKIFTVIQEETRKHSHLRSWHQMINQIYDLMIYDFLKHHTGEFLWFNQADKASSLLQ